MIEKDKLYSIWVYLQAEPLFWLTLTIGSYLIGDYFYQKMKGGLKNDNQSNL